MRSHGWSGNTPASDEEAIDRILDAVEALVAECGSAIRITDVARTLGVSRQTVYRYFPGTEALLFASRMRSADGFLNRLAEHVRGLNDPAVALVEGVAFAVENLALDHQLMQLIDTRLQAETIVSSTSQLALAFGRTMLHRYDVDWVRHHFDDAGLDELAEMSVRTVHSLLSDPGQPPKDPITLRRFVARWLGPAILYPQIARAVEALYIPAGVG
jgi:AcrR family transcriptional regulator